MAQTTSTAVVCLSCGNDALYVGKLPAIGLHAAVDVFKCEACMRIDSKPAGMAESSVPKPSGRPHTPA